MRYLAGFVVALAVAGSPLCVSAQVGEEAAPSKPENIAALLHVRHSLPLLAFEASDYNLDVEPLGAQPEEVTPQLALLPEYLQ